MENLAKKLLRLKEDIEKAKEERIGLEALNKKYMEDLKEKFGTKSIKEASKFLSTLEKEREGIDEKIQKIIDKIEENYGAI